MEKYNSGSSHNLFIVWEGIEGCGKDTQIPLVGRYYFSVKDDKYDRNKRNTVIMTREQTKGIHGKLIKRWFDSGKDITYDPETLLYLFIKDRKDHLATILEKNYFQRFEGEERNVILCGRYYYSGAYQLTQLLDKTMEESPNQNYEELRQKYFDYIFKPQLPFIIPDLTIYPRISGETSLNRLKKNRGHKEMFEKKASFLERVVKNYLFVFDMFRKRGHDIVEIDGEQEIDKVFSDTVKVLEEANIGALDFTKFGRDEPKITREDYEKIWVAEAPFLDEIIESKREEAHIFFRRFE